MRRDVFEKGLRKQDWNAFYAMHEERAENSKEKVTETNNYELTKFAGQRRPRLRTTPETGSRRILTSESRTDVRSTSGTGPAPGHALRPTPAAQAKTSVHLVNRHYQPIRGKMSLPPDCWLLDTFDWTPLDPSPESPQHASVGDSAISKAEQGSNHDGANQPPHKQPQPQISKGETP